MDEEVEIVQKGPRGAFQHSDNVRQKAMPISAIETVEEPRIDTDLAELNRVLGGGIVPGSLVLIGWRSWNREIDVATSSFLTSRESKDTRAVYFR